MSNREVFRFAEEAQEQFGFLIEKYGFEIISRSNTKVRYESKTVFIEAFHGERDYEVGVNFGRVGTSEQFSFLLFCRLKKVEAVTSVEMISDERAQIKIFLCVLAKALAENGHQIIEGDSELFEKMKTVRWWDFDPAALGKKGKSDGQN